MESDKSVVLETENTDSASRPKRKIKKILLRGILLFIGVLFIWSQVYKYSGSSQWEFEGERNGVKLYSLKYPGSSLKKYKAITQIQSSLSAFVSAAIDPETGSDTGMYDSRPIDIIQDDPQFFHGTFKSDFPPPFKTREVVLLNHYYQNPRTKELLFRAVAVPGLIPLDDRYVRVPRMNNTWRLTPLGEDGEVEVEWVVDMDDGGFLPHFFQNFLNEEYMYGNLPRLQALVNKEKHRNAKFDFIEEVAGSDSLAQPELTQKD